MKLYGTAAGASMDMAHDPALRAQLIALIASRRIDVAIETGTFLGLGSTRFVCEAFRAVAPPRRFVTIEVNFVNWCRARANLRGYGFVDCRWGRSVALDRAVAFLRDDPMLRDRADLDIFIDNDADPAAAYAREISGAAAELEAVPLAQDTAAMAEAMRPLLFDGEDLLARMLGAHADHAPLVVLDSAGGIGWLEFQILRQTMAGRRYAVLLDDTHHVKHYRSLQHILATPAFRVVAQGASWVLATQG